MSLPAITIANRKFSFIRFNAVQDEQNCCFENSQFCLPVINDTDIYFQFSVVCNTVQESEDLLNIADDEVQLILLRGAGNSPLSPNIIRNYATANSLYFTRHRTGRHEITFCWMNPLTGLYTDLACEECFQFGVFFPDEEGVETMKISNCMVRKCGDCYLSVLEYSNEEDYGEFRYCNVVDGFVNRVRLPFYLSQPQFTDEESIYTRSDGSIKSLKSVTKKEYLVQTEFFPEFIHERLKVALGHDSTITYSLLGYNGGFRKSGSYEIEWSEGMCKAPAKFKALVTPFNVRNSNCAECEAIDINCVQIEDVGCFVGYDYALHEQVFTFIWALLPGISQVNIQSRIHGTPGWTDNLVPANTIPSVLNLPLGIYDFRLFAVGTDCITQYSPIFDSQGTATEPTCEQPSGLSIGDLTATSATAQWTTITPAPAGFYDWELFEGVALVASDIGYVIPGGTQIVSLTGLTPNTWHTFRVRSHCGGSGSTDYSAWTMITFQTLP